MSTQETTPTTTSQAGWFHPPNVVSKLKRDSEEYLKDRLQYKINSYTRKGRIFRLAYWGMASVAAIGSAVVPALINMKDDVTPWVTTSISLLVAAMVALEGIFHPRELWRNYDLIAAALREEEMRYSTHTAPYDKDEVHGVDRFHRLVQRVEERIKEERSDTISLRTAPTEEGGQG